MSLRNTIFERTTVLIIDTGGYASYFDATPYSSQITAANNLFFGGTMMPYPVLSGSQGASWTFVDNLFDRVTFNSDGAGNLLNGPVGVNHHDAYVAMTTRLSPAAPTSTDPVGEKFPAFFQKLF